MSARTKSGTAGVTCHIPARWLTTTQDGYDKCET
jgi:hypothetical protein